MKKSNKVLSVVLATALTMSMLSGCGNSNNENTETTTPETTETTETSETTTEETAEATTEETAASGVIKIGGIGPTTGGAAVYGQAIMNGAQIAVDEINAAGGINGMTIEFNFQDDEHDAERAVNAYNSLKDWGMQILMGTVTSSPCIAVAAETANDNLFQITPSGTAVDCITNDNAFRMCFSDPSQGVESAKYIAANGMGTKIAVIYDSSDVYSTGIYEAFAQEAATQGLEIVEAQAFTADSKTDFSVQVQKARDAEADLVFLPIYYSEAALILAEADRQGLDTQFFGCDGLDGLLGLEGFDASLAEGVAFLVPFASTSSDSMVQSFVAEYEAQFGETPNQFAADAYDSIYVIKTAIETAGNVTEDMSASDICEALKAAMTTISYDGVTGKGITWVADGEPNKEPLVVKVENGVYIEQ